MAKEKEKKEETKETDEFGKPVEDNAFGITSVQPTLPDEPPAEEEKPEAEKPKEEKPAEEKPKEEPKKEPEEKPDKLLEDLKAKSPIFKELCEKKSFKNIDDAFKAYTELEKDHTKKSQLSSVYKKALEPYIVFDEEGNPIGYTDLGKKTISSAEVPLPKETPAVAPSALTPEQQQALEGIKEKFWELFEANPIEAITRISLAVAQYGQKGISNEFKKSLEGLNTQIKPLLEKAEDERLLAMIDEVAQEQVKAGDEKAQEFIDEYADEIEAELKKISPEFRKANPKLAIEQAYLKVKNLKVEEWKNQLAKKQEEAQKQAQAQAETGESTGGGAESPEEPEFKDMKESLKTRPDSAFFGV